MHVMLNNISTYLVLQPILSKQNKTFTQFLAFPQYPININKNVSENNNQMRQRI